MLDMNMITYKRGPNFKVELDKLEQTFAQLNIEVNKRNYHLLLINTFKVSIKVDITYYTKNYQINNLE